MPRGRPVNPVDNGTAGHAVQGCRVSQPAQCPSPLAVCRTDLPRWVALSTRPMPTASGVQDGSTQMGWYCNPPDAHRLWRCRGRVYPDGLLFQPAQCPSPLAVCRTDLPRWVALSTRPMPTASGVQDGSTQMGWYCNPPDAHRLWRRAGRVYPCERSRCTSQSTRKTANSGRQFNRTGGRYMPIPRLTYSGTPFTSNHPVTNCSPFLGAARAPIPGIRTCPPWE